MINLVPLMITWICRRLVIPSVFVLMMLLKFWLRVILTAERGF